ncbi:DUF4145 domain-containing protein [Pseudomonas sp. CDFA 610]|uniref:DUF4145 domain-containing protein n=1 Tax=Pseudomonas sp. CDFA 610 TaxID=2829825 RepID=UPI001E4233B2|nr:DUF4145 domain-containing protein [Pseudomonas sp. CDFA 610]MCD5983871.1 DUF4145 domain-containing protein [Pseudomonas sp. CDFA 610]
MFDKATWQGCYERRAIPKFRCPQCRSGRLIVDPSNIQVRHPEFSQIQCQRDDYEPGWERERFSVELKCDEASCGEVSFAIGDTSAEEYYEPEVDAYAWMTLLHIRGFFPAPPIISVPTQMPYEIQRELEKAFGLYWSDLNATANRLRVTAERIMDDQGVPHEALTKKNVLNRLDLNGRIALFSHTHPEHADTMTALRMVGNLGSHGNDVQREAILDAFEVFEDCLLELYGERTARLKKLKDKLITSKGKY